MKINKIKTAKGKEGIEVNKFRYRKDKPLITTGEVNWRCTFKNCSASIKTNSTVTVVKSKPTAHNHEPPDTKTPSSPSISEPSTPTSQTPSLQTPSRSIPTTDVNSEAITPSPSLTELLSPYTTLTPVPPTFSQPEEENNHLRQRVAELIYINEALTDRLIALEKQVTSKDCNETIFEIKNTDVLQSAEAKNDQQTNSDETKNETPNVSPEKRSPKKHIQIKYMS